MKLMKEGKNIFILLNFEIYINKNVYNNINKI